MKDLNNEKSEMKTMVSCCNMLNKLGFTIQFKALATGLKSLTTERVYKPEEVKVVNFYRFEGESNPADNAILYAIETCVGERGTLSDAYGPYADLNVTNFMAKVDLISKKVNKDESL